MEIIEPKPNIDALMNASTYQGMTDVEIDAIIAYKVDAARRDATLSADAESHESMMRELIERQESACRAAQDSMRAALSATPVYKKVSE